MSFLSVLKIFIVLFENEQARNSLKRNPVQITGYDSVWAPRRITRSMSRSRSVINDVSDRLPPVSSKVGV